VGQIRKNSQTSSQFYISTCQNAAQNSERMTIQEKELVGTQITHLKAESHTRVTREAQQDAQA
jgi:hypothetical protein